MRGNSAANTVDNSIKEIGSFGKSFLSMDVASEILLAWKQFVNELGAYQKDWVISCLNKNSPFCQNRRHATHGWQCRRCMQYSGNLRLAAGK